MNKQEIMKALEICNNVCDETCVDCPYNGAPNCERMLGHDAVDLLNSEPVPIYQVAYIYTKRNNLSKWFASKGCQRRIAEDSDAYQRLKNHYEQERIIELVMLVRHEDIRIGANIYHKRYCKIKCPINPLPIKGEFEITSAADMGRLLMSMGWGFSHKINLNSSLYK